MKLNREYQITVLLSSHILSEVSAVCDTVLILSHGRLVASDTPENLSRRLSARNTLLLTVRGTPEAVRSALSPFGEQAAVSLSPSEAEPGAVDVRLETADETDLREPVFYRLASAKLPLLAMSCPRASLEDVFLELTGDNATEEDDASEETEAPDEPAAEEAESDEAPAASDGGKGE